MLYEHLEALSWFASFRYLSFPGMGRVLQHVPPKSVTQRRQVHFGLTRELVHKRSETPAEAGGSHQPKEDFVAHMLRNGGDANNKGMSVPELEANINDLLLAGTETSSTALTGITNLLLQNHHKLTALINKIHTTFPHKSDITSSAVYELRHLGAVIEEGLRLAPPVPEGLARIVAPEGQFIAGHWIPGGVRLLSPPPPLPPPPPPPPQQTNTIPALFPKTHAPQAKHSPPDPRLRAPIRHQPLPSPLRLPLRISSLPLAPAQTPRLLIARFQPVLARPAQLHREECRVQRDAARGCEVAVGV